MNISKKAEYRNIRHIVFIEISENDHRITDHTFGHRSFGLMRLMTKCDFMGLTLPCEKLNQDFLFYNSEFLFCPKYLTWRMSWHHHYKKKSRQMLLLHMVPDNILLKRMLNNDSISKKSENLRFTAISKIRIVVISTKKMFNNFCYMSKSYTLRFKLCINANTIKSKAANASY